MNRWENAVVRLGCAVMREIADAEDDEFALWAITRGVTVAGESATIDGIAVRLRVGRAYGINGAINTDDDEAGSLARAMVDEMRKGYALDKGRA